jgi:serine/threonine-protein kinase RsbW
VRDVLSDHPRAVTDAAELLASELTTNCVRHAHTDFELTVEVDRHVRVEVRDRGTGTPRVLSPRPTDPSGRGLRIVDALSDDWGVEERSDGKAVWFTLSSA